MFAQDGRAVRSRTFVAHIRYASTGALEERNTHPFEQDGRLFAHNGVLGDLDRLDATSAPTMRSSKATPTPSACSRSSPARRRRTGDIERGIAAAARWVGRQPARVRDQPRARHRRRAVGAALPRTHDLLVLERDAGGPAGDGHLAHRSPRGRIRVHSADLAQQRAVVVATERMDDDPGWTPLASGELLHVDADLRVTRRQVLDAPPAHPLTLQDLGVKAAASQGAETR